MGASGPRPGPSLETRSVVLFTITPREVLCGISAIAPGTYTATGIAGSDCRLLRIPAERFNRALNEEPAFTYTVLHLFAERLRRIAEYYGTMAEPVPQRVVRTILRLRDQFGATIPVTHRELAQMSWTTTDSAIRAVRTLKRRGVVRGRRGQLTIHNLRALTALAATVTNGRAAL